MPAFCLQAIQLSERITVAQLLASLMGVLGLLKAFGIIASQVSLRGSPAASFTC